MVKVKFIESHPRYAYHAGNIAELDDKHVSELLEARCVQIILPASEGTEIENRKRKTERNA